MGDPVRTIQPTPKGRGKEYPGPAATERCLPKYPRRRKEPGQPCEHGPPEPPRLPYYPKKHFPSESESLRGKRPGPATTERCLPERARRRRKGSAMPKHHLPRTSKTPMLKSKMPPTEQTGNGTAEASAFPVHSRDGVTRASGDRALPPWPLQASRLG
ncbi:hypothetical protein D5F01_LYC24463 [Larimichthys crocea]|uniref:Uncharacterized protein n=1 Tax=Larimichthys crocea TaxID=215358 RepID=A0A6G0HEC8_LARCR|nr:hypothetical protein D5F01_LYC24463 [Larimichthys crocea]